MAQRESAMSPVGCPPSGPFGSGTPSHSQLVPREPIRLVIAEGHQIVRLGLERFLGSIEDFTVVATATDGPESLAAVRAHAPDVVVLDIRLSRSEEHTSELQSRPHLVCRLLLEKKKKKSNDVQAADVT